jgi:hypothetical protein
MARMPPTSAALRKAGVKRPCMSCGGCTSRIPKGLQDFRNGFRVKFLASKIKRFSLGSNPIMAGADVLSVSPKPNKHSIIKHFFNSTMRNTFTAANPLPLLLARRHFTNVLLPRSQK